MGIITGAIDVPTSVEEIAYSEDTGVVAGKLAGCGWAPVDGFDKLTDEADLVECRSLTDTERTRYRNFHAAQKPADANVYAVMTAVERVTTKVGGKVVRLRNAKAVEWVRAVARTNPTALDLLADRIIWRTSGREPSELYAGIRATLGYGPLEVEEGGADADSKSADLGGA